MHFDERTEGPYRIYTGALESPQGDGYIAAVVVKRIDSQAPTARETFRDDSLACGHRWETAADALGYAMARGREAIARQAKSASC